MELYCVLVLSIHLYGAVAWTLKKEDENRLLVFELMCLRKVPGVSVLNQIQNNRISQSLDLNYTTIDWVNHKMMRLFRHMQRMNSNRYPDILMEANITEKRLHGRPAKRWTDYIKDSCSAQYLTSIYQMARMAMDREEWRNIMDQMARQSDPPVPMPSVKPFQELFFNQYSDSFSIFSKNLHF